MMRKVCTIRDDIGFSWFYQYGYFLCHFFL